jgi:hypothetical protein
LYLKGGNPENDNHIISPASRQGNSFVTIVCILGRRFGSLRLILIKTSKFVYFKFTLSLSGQMQMHYMTSKHLLYEYQPCQPLSVDIQPPWIVKIVTEYFDMCLLSGKSIVCGGQH